jgi:replication factor C large subunit
MTSAIEWAEKYRPRTLKEIVGNKKAVHDLKAWAEEWLSGIPEKRAVVLYGAAGVGKTSSAHALAQDMGWEVIELNASDQRTAGVIEKIAGSAASMNTLFGGKRLIILDEADNLHGSADRGGMRAVAGIIKTTLQPIILIANDVYGLTPTIRNLCLEIKFGSVQSRSMIPALKVICQSEGISCSADAVQQIAENTGGDLRSAINDLQAAASGKQVLETKDISTSGRDVKENIFKAMQKIFKSTDCKRALEAARGLDESPEDLIHWIDENLPIQYASKDGDIEDIRTGFSYLSKADLYLGRVKKRQNYQMWRYASTLMVCGSAISKTRAYPGFIKYQQPSLWKRLGQTRSKRDLRDNIASKIGEHSFESIRYSRNSLLELYSRMVKDEGSAIEITAGLGLELEELMYLSGSTKPSKKLQKIYDKAKELGSEETEEGFFKNPVISEDKRERTPECAAKPSEEKAGNEKKVEKTLDKSKNPNFRASKDKQRTLNSDLDVFPKVSEKNQNFETHVLFVPEYDNSASLEKNILLSSARSEANLLSGLKHEKSKEPSELLSNESILNEDILENAKSVVSKVSDLEPEELELKSRENRTESKTQKTLFDF